MKRMVILNEQQLNVAIKDLRNEFIKNKSINLSYEKMSKPGTLRQQGFIFKALLSNITQYFRDYGFNVTEEDVRYKIYKDVSLVLPEIVVDNQLFGKEQRIKHLPEIMESRELTSKFINSIFVVLNENPIYNGIKLHPSIRYNWVFHLTLDEINACRTQDLPERDEGYLNYQRSLPCIICGLQHGSEVHHIRDTRTAGTAIKSPDWYAIPLCHDCHLRVAHGTGFKDAMRWIKIDLIDFCRICYMRWRNKLT